MVEWSKGYSASYYMTVVDPSTWLDVDRIEITGGSISRQLDGLRQSADINCMNYPLNVEQWIRIYLDVRQNEDGAHHAIFTGLATSPDRDINGTRSENALQCYSVLKPADDVLLPRGWFAYAGTSTRSLINDLLDPISAPFDINGTPPGLTETIVAEDGETKLSMLERILLLIEWDLRISGDGSIVIEKIADDSVCTFDPIEFDVIETKISVKTDWYECPNVFMATSNDVMAIAKDESETSPLSIQNRGREVWMSEEVNGLTDNTTISEYASLRLEQEQRYSLTASYNRRYVPDIVPGDTVTMHYPDQGIEGQFMITSQSIDLGYAARTAEEIMGV